MKLTTSDVITLLPFDAEFKSSLQSAFASMTGDKKFTFERLIWNTYDQLYEDKLQEHLDEQLEDVLHGRRELSSNLYHEGVDLVGSETQMSEETGLKNTELQDIRNKLQTLITN